MRLLKVDSGDELSLTKLDNPPDRYAILSHTWGREDEEVTLDDIVGHKGKNKSGYPKVSFCANQARADGFKYIWVDTCCINQTDSVERSEAIHSMFEWYSKSTKCYVFLSDVSVSSNDQSSVGGSWRESFRKSRWFTRGWTLQELLAPKNVEFFSHEGERLGTKDTLEYDVHEVTGIPVDALRADDLSAFTANERLRWIEGRETKKSEDRAYCLLGIFGVSMPYIPGEGEHAFRRLMDEINKNSLTGNKTSLQALWTTDYKEKLKLIDRPIPGTGLWFLGHPLFVDWSSRQRGGILWYSADPGTGKSVLFRHVVEELQTKAEGSVLYYFFNECAPQDSTIEAALQALLHQLCYEQHQLLGTVTHYVQRQGRAVTQRLSSLHDLLKECIARTTAGQITCVIDGLDQCTNLNGSNGPELAKFSDILTSLMEVAKNRGKILRFLISSRSYSEYTSEILWLAHSHCLEHIQGEAEANNIAADMAICIDHWLKNLAVRLRLSEAEVQALQFHFDGARYENFLCVSLVARYVSEQTPSTIEDLLARLQHLPTRLEDFYARALNRCSDQTKARVTFAAVIAACCPLESSQLYAVIEQNQCRVTSRPPVQSRSTERIREICGLLLRVVDGKVYLIHNSLRSFLLKPGGARVSMAQVKRSRKSRWQNTVTIEEGQVILASACIQCLRSPTTRTACFWLHLQQYATEHGLYHVSKALQISRRRQKHRLEGMLGLGLDLTMVDSRGKSLLHRIVDTNSVDTNLVLTLIHHGGLMQHADYDNMTCLHYAALWENTQLIQILVDAGFDVNTTVDRGYPPTADSIPRRTTSRNKGLTPLHYAALFGRAEGVESLLTKGADAAAFDESGTTALHLALSWRVEGPNIEDSWTEYVRMPEYIWDFDDIAMMTATSDRPERLRLDILYHLCRAPNVQPGYTDAAGRTALHHVHYSEVDSAINTVKFLLGRGYDPTAQDGGGRTPVHLAAHAGDTPSLQALVRHADDLMTPDFSGSNALHLAVQANHLDAAEYILSAASRIGIHRTADHLDRNALHHALGPLADLSVVRLLLSCGIDGTHVDHEGKDPLTYHLAGPRFFADSHLTRVMIENGANVSHLDADGRNLAHLLVDSGSKFELDGLLQLSSAGVDVTAVDRHGRTILHMAAIAGSINRELLSHMTQCAHMRLEQRDTQGKRALDYILEKVERDEKLPRGLWRRDRWKMAQQAFVSYNQGETGQCECGSFNL